MAQLTAQEQNLLTQMTAVIRQVVREELEAAKPVEQPVPVVAEQPVVAEGGTTNPPKWYEKKKVKK